MDNPTVLFVSHKSKQCGVYQYGINTRDALFLSKHILLRYAECDNVTDLARAVSENTPHVILYNYFPCTMNWLNPSITRSFGVPAVGMLHEMTQAIADSYSNSMFDFVLCPDPTIVENNPIIKKIPRLLFDRPNVQQSTGITIGSFGFGIGDKGFDRLISMVQNEFDEAVVKLLMPFNDVIDIGGTSHALATARRCKSVVSKIGIRLEISHDFLSKNDLLAFLAGNTLNAFLYDTHKERGISSVIDYALSSGRPLAITRCGMFRHISSAIPSICIEDSSLKDIISRGTVPLTDFYNQWNRDNFIKRYEDLMIAIANRNHCV